MVLHAAALVLATCAGLAAVTRRRFRDGRRGPDFNRFAQIIVNDKGFSRRAGERRARGLARLRAGDEQALADARRDEENDLLRRLQARRARRRSSVFFRRSPDALADTANMLRLRLPTEPNFGVLRYSCEQIAREPGIRLA